MTPERTLGIIGTGLMGASIGLRARELGWNVLGYDCEDAASQRALQCNALDEIVTREALYERSGVLVFAAYAQATLEEIERIDRNAQPRAALMIDVASVKTPIVRSAAGLANFVASHPLAGAERSGADAARSDLFSGKPWLYVPSAQPAVSQRAVEFITALGGRPCPLDAAEHDVIVAMTSHVPQIFATLFAGALNARGGQDRYCGPAARELLRLSRSSFPMWRDILELNGANIAAELRALAGEMEAAAKGLERRDSGFLAASFARAHTDNDRRG